MHKYLSLIVKYRKDINGLRAWAVIAVLLFHFSLIGLPGGFVGVDIFFVISGYLMTTIIISGFEKGSFSLWKFYMSRVRRIVPTLLVVITILLLLGWFYLPTVDYQELGHQSVYSLSFLSNIGFWKSAGYFDSISEEKWLLHTWSLAVEAQFYILYPLFIALIWKLFKNIKAITIALIIVFITSLALSVFATIWKPSAAFYLLPTRGWELVSGGLVYLIIKQKLAPTFIKEKGYWLGWILILLSFLFIKKELAWPGYWAILPVLGASLLILGQKESCILTDNRIAQWLGDRSYALYLWHWPLVVALNFASLQNEWIWIIGALMLSILLAHLSYLFIETPTRKYLTQASFKKEIIIGIVTFFLGLIAINIQNYTFSKRIENQVLIDTIASESINKNWFAQKCSYSILGDKQEGCIFGTKKDKPNLIFIGDSFSEATVSALSEAAKQYNKTILYLGGAHDCAVAKGFDEKKLNSICPKYYGHLQKKLKAFSKTPVLIITSARYFSTTTVSKKEKQKNLEGMTQAYKEFSEGRTLFIAYPIPINKNANPKAISRDLLFKRKTSKEKYKQPIEDVLSQYKDLREYQKAISDKLNLKILDPMKYLCDKEYCYGSKNGRPIYYDGAHLSEYGNKLLVPMFEEVFKNDKALK